MLNENEWSKFCLKQLYKVILCITYVSIQTCYCILSLELHCDVVKSVLTVQWIDNFCSFKLKLKIENCLFSWTSTVVTCKYIELCFCLVLVYTLYEENIICHKHGSNYYKSNEHIMATEGNFIFKS